MIYVDLDGVIRNILAPICKFYKESLLDIDSWEHRYGPNQLSVKDILSMYPYMYDQAPIIESGIQLLSWLAEHSLEFEILTHQYPFGVEKTEEWCKKHLPPTVIVRYVDHAADKLQRLGPTDILIDDNPALYGDPHVWLVHRPYNAYLVKQQVKDCLIVHDHHLIPAIEHTYLRLDGPIPDGMYPKDDLDAYQENQGGTKYDSGKVRMDLLPVDALEKIAEVFTKGAEKYGDRNWEEGIKYSRLYGALLRHVQNGFWNGEDLDHEWNLPHLAHAGCCILMLLSMQLRRPDLDDRPGKTPDNIRCDKPSCEQCSVSNHTDQVKEGSPKGGCYSFETDQKNSG